MTTPLSRRRALTSAATAGIGVPLLAACGDDGGASSAGDPTVTPTTASASTDASTTAASPEGGGAAAGPLVATKDVPVGGGVVLADEELVVTQPTEGEFKAFTAICTHTGCLVGSVEDAKILCPCHGSSYDIADGSVTGGPAPEPLAAVQVKVSGDEVVRS